MEETIGEKMKVVVRERFEPVLRSFNRTSEYWSRVEDYLKSDEIRELKSGCNDPGVLLRISCLEEQIEIHHTLLKMVNDILDLDWNKPETELVYKSIKRCFIELDKKRQESDFIFLGIIGEERGA